MTIPALIPPDLLDAAAQQLQSNAARSPRKRKREYLLIGGRLRCAVCGHHMIGTMLRDKRSYRCFRQYNGERRPSCRLLRADRVEPQVWEEVCRLVRTPALLTQLLADYRRTEAPAQIAHDRTRLQQDLQKTTRALERLLDLYLADELSRELYTTKKQAFDQEATLAQTKLLALEAQEQANADAVAQQAELTEVLQAVATIVDEATTIPAQQRIVDMLGLTVLYERNKTLRLQIVLKKRPAASSGAGGVVSHSNTVHHTGTRDNIALTLTWTLAA